MNKYLFLTGLTFVSITAFASDTSIPILTADTHHAPAMKEKWRVLENEADRRNEVSYKLDLRIETTANGVQNASALVADGESATIELKGTKLVLHPTREGAKVVNITRLNAPAELAERNEKGELIFKIKITPSSEIKPET